MVTSTKSRRSHARALAAVAVGLLLVVGLAACSDDDDDGGTLPDSTTTVAGGGGSTVVAKDFSLTSVTVAPGSEVTFSNEGSATHTMTADDGAFDAGRVAGGSNATVTAPTDPGAYPFHCEIHSSMTGTLTVQG